MDSINIIILSVLMISAITLLIRAKLTARRRERKKRFNAMRSDFEQVNQEMEEWEAEHPLHTEDDPKFQSLLKIKIQCFRQAAFSKGRLTAKERKYLEKLQGMQTPPREWSD